MKLNPNNFCTIAQIWKISGGSSANYSIISPIWVDKGTGISTFAAVFLFQGKISYTTIRKVQPEPLLNTQCYRDSAGRGRLIIWVWALSRHAWVIEDSRKFSKGTNVFNYKKRKKKIKDRKMVVNPTMEFSNIYKHLPSNTFHQQRKMSLKCNVRSSTGAPASYKWIWEKKWFWLDPIQ